MLNTSQHIHCPRATGLSAENLPEWQSPESETSVDSTTSKRFLTSETTASLNMPKFSLQSLTCLLPPSEYTKPLPIAKSLSDSTQGGGNRFSPDSGNPLPGLAPNHAHQIIRRITVQTNRTNQKGAAVAAAPGSVACGCPSARCRGRGSCRRRPARCGRCRRRPSRGRSRSGRCWGRR